MVLIRKYIFLPGCNVLSITVGFSVFNNVVPPGKEIMCIMIHGTQQGHSSHWEYSVYKSEILLSVLDM